MKYRPEYFLDRLRMMMGPANGDADHPGLHLQWLRTVTIDLSRIGTHSPPDVALERWMLPLRSAVGCAVEQVVLKHHTEEHLALVSSHVARTVCNLVALDMGACYCSRGADSLLRGLALHHQQSLRRLVLPSNSDVTQQTLCLFSQLEELHADACRGLTSVEFCSATLRVLYADASSLTDEGLRNATKLEVLHVSHCSLLSDVSPFAHRLIELNPATRMGSAALAGCHRLRVLYATNGSITTLRPFVSQLRELHAAQLTWSVADVELADAVHLVKLHVNNKDRHHVTTVTPFATSLRELTARNSTIAEGLDNAANLVCLDVSYSTVIGKLGPSLLELDAVESCLLSDSLTGAEKIIRLNVDNNRHITTVEPFGRSLRHLSAQYQSLLGDPGLSSATRLVTLHCCGNDFITTFQPFAKTLQELAVQPTLLRLVYTEEIVRRPRPSLHLLTQQGVSRDGPSPVPLLDTIGFVEVWPLLRFARMFSRNTVTYSVPTGTVESLRSSPDCEL